MNGSVKIEKKETEIDIPKDFMRKIKKLGMREEDAQILYKSKIDWTAVYSNNKLYCTERTCNFFTKIDNEELTNHMIKVHNYGQFKCEYNHCDFIGFSKTSLNLHRKMHTMAANQKYALKCSKPNCDASFPNEIMLSRHMRLHNNDLDMCQYCPYRYERPNHYKRHLKIHFGIKDLECDQCDRKFLTSNELKEHYELHEGIIYCCLICKVYESKYRNTIEHHLKRKHAEVLKNETSWKVIRQYTKTK